MFTQFPSLAAIEENANILSRLSQMYLKRLFLDLSQISSGLLGPDPGQLLVVKINPNGLELHEVSNVLKSFGWQVVSSSEFFGGF